MPDAPARTIHNARIAYFSMEVGLSPRMPTYSGGLGMLAGDALRAGADAGLRMVGVTLLHRHGYFFQRVDAEGVQTEQPARWAVDDELERLPERVRLTLRGRTVHVGAWRCAIPGQSGEETPVILLDTDLDENHPDDRVITHWLYGGDQTYRLLQEAVLGIGGLRMLRALGAASIERIHMNEGHAAFAALELLREISAASDAPPHDERCLTQVRRRCVFTTHTPVPAGHDTFPLDLVREVLDPELAAPWRSRAEVERVAPGRDRLNMTLLALHLSGFVNGVARWHAQVTRAMFPGFAVEAVTNGVHAPTWMSPHIAALLDQHLPRWRTDTSHLRLALGLPAGAIALTHQAAKRDLLREVNRLTSAGLDETVFTIGFGRRFTAYKRPDLLLHDVRRLRAVAEECGPVQIVYAGKAHPRDEEGKQIIRRVIATLRELDSPALRGVFVPNYDMHLCRLMVAGCDLWLNTPTPPLEASGTSGMKAAMNGVPSLSVLDGWWLEGCIEGVTGWSIGSAEATDAGVPVPPLTAHDHANELYAKLEAILRLAKERPEAYHEIMRSTLAINGAAFSAQRMMREYAAMAYA